MIHDLYVILCAHSPSQIIFNHHIFDPSSFTTSYLTPLPLVTTILLSMSFCLLFLFIHLLLSYPIYEWNHVKSNFFCHLKVTEINVSYAYSWERLLKISKIIDSGSGWWASRANPGSSGRKAGRTLAGHPSTTGPLIHPHSLRPGQLDMPVPLTCTSLQHGQKLESPEETHADIGRMCKPTRQWTPWAISCVHPLKAKCHWAKRCYLRTSYVSPHLFHLQLLNTGLGGLCLAGQY